MDVFFFLIKILISNLVWTMDFLINLHSKLEDWKEAKLLKSLEARKPKILNRIVKIGLRFAHLFLKEIPENYY